MNQKSLPVALIKGVRSSLARPLAEELSTGYALVVESHEEERQDLVNALLRQGALAVRGDHDLTHEKGAADAVAHAVDTFGAVDVVVIIGGISADRAFLRVEGRSWHQLVARHLDTTFFTCQAAARWMVEHRRPGRFICVTNKAGAITAEFGRAHLAGVLGGVFSLTRAMAVELRPKGITVNAVATAIDDQQPSKDSVTPLIQFLVSSEASDITGQVISVDGPKLSVIRPVNSAGAFTEGACWTPEEIGRRWGELSR